VIELIFVFVWLAALFSIGVLIGWRWGRNSLPTPTIEQVAEYMSGVVENEDYEARVRRNENMLRMSGRDAMPRGNSGPPARITKMRINKRDRRNP